MSGKLIHILSNWIISATVPKELKMITVLVDSSQNDYDDNF